MGTLGHVCPQCMLQRTGRMLQRTAAFFPNTAELAGSGAAAGMTSAGKPGSDDANCRAM